MSDSIKVLLVLLAMFVLSGCGRDPGPDGVRQNTDGQYIAAYTDPASGCQYLLYGSNGVTPRMNREGKQICVTP